MDINYSEIADELFTTLVGAGFKVEAFDNTGEPEIQPQLASKFVSPQLVVNLDRDRNIISVDIEKELANHSIIDQLKNISGNYPSINFDYKVFGMNIKPKRESIMTAIESVKPRKLDEVLPALAAGVVGRMAAGAAVRAGAGELGSALTGSAASSAVKSALSSKDLEDVDVDEAHDEDHNDKIYAQMHAIAQRIGDREEVAAERRRKIFHPEEFADQVKFSVSSDKAQHAVTSRWGEFISQDEDGHFVAPRTIWSKIEQTAHNADGVGAEEIYDTETMQAMKSESSDPSGVFHAAKHLNKSFLVKAEMAQGGTKTFRVKAQSERVAREKFAQHHAQAKVLSVKEEQGMAEGYWQDAVKKAEAEREARKGKPFEKNPASHDKQGVYKGDKDLAGNPVPKRKEQGVAEGQQVNEESHDVYKDYIAMGHSHAEAMRAAREYEDKQKSRDYENYVTKIYINDKHWQKGDNNILGERGAQKAAQHAANIARKTGKRVSIHMIDLANSDTLAIADFDNGKWKYRDLTASATESVTEDSADRTVHISKDDWVPFVDWMESEGLGISEEDGIKHNDLGDVIELVFPPANTSWNNDAAWMYASEWDVRDQNMQEDAQIDEAFKDDLKKLFGIIGLAGTIGYGAWLDHLATYDTPLVHEIVRQAQAGNEGAIKDLHNISLRDGSTVELNRLLNKYGFRSEYERKTPEPTMERSTPVPPPKVGFAKHGRKAKARMPYRSVNQDKYAPAAYDEKKAKTRKDIEDYFYRKEIGENMTKQSVTEGFGHMLGSTKTSYQPLDGVKIIVRHKSAVSEEVRGSRSRNIKEIFIQRGDERFKMKEASLQAARAMARHVHSGGEVYDQIGKAINEMATEQKALANFVRFVSRSGMVNETNQEYVDLATKRVHAIREAFRKLMGPKTYANAVENINNEVSVELTETDLDLESKFTSISCDKRVTNAVASMQSALARESAFASAIEEAINKEDFGAIKHRLQEQDAIQFENANARLAHQVSQLSGVAQDARLGTYLNNISKKIGEGIELEAFETKTVKLCLERAKCKGGRKKSKMESRDSIKESKSYAEFLEKFDIF